MVLVSLFCGLSLQVHAAEKLDAVYNFYWKGILVGTAETKLAIAPETYAMQMGFRIRGIAKLFANGHSEISAQGHLTQNGDLIPTSYTSTGRWDGKDYAQTMIFDANGALAEQKLDWPQKWLEEFKREPVPEGLQIGPDPASLIAKLVRLPLAKVTEGEGHVERTFDGDSVSDFKMTCSADRTVLKSSRHSPFSGEAHACSFSADLVAGERILTEKQQKKAEKRRRKEEKRRAKGKKQDDRKPPALWVQPFGEDTYLLPVRAEVETDMGRVVMYLKELNVVPIIGGDAIVALNSTILDTPSR
jgi:hypothetical protein